MRIINEPNVLPVLEAMKDMRFYSEQEILVIFGEAYGGHIGSNAQQYTVEGKTPKFRVFDVFSMPMDEVVALFKSMTAAQLNGWAGNANQPFMNEVDLQKFCVDNGFNMTPRLKKVHGCEMPISVEEAMEWMKQFESTVAAIDTPSEGQKANGKYGRSEGVVCRTVDRKFIRKLRFEDYNKGKLKNFYR